MESFPAQGFGHLLTLALHISICVSPLWIFRFGLVFLFGFMSNNCKAVQITNKMTAAKTSYQCN